MAGVGNAVNSVGHAFGSAGHAFGSTRVGQALQKATGARIPGTSGTVGKAAMAAAFGGIPGIALYAMKQRGNFAQQQRTSEQDAQQKAAKQAELDQMGNTMMESIRRQTISN
jgi:broad specificity polyphosphatase/5'/3'-nucleotidase SurE